MTTGAMADGPRTTPGTEGCRCVVGAPTCDMPCWQRVGLLKAGCESCGCPPHEEVDEP